MHVWQQVLAAVGGFAAVVGAIAWLIRIWFEHSLATDLENHKATLAAIASHDLEQFKAQLATASAEHQFRFGKLHEKRVEVLADLFTQCSDLGISLSLLQLKLDLQKQGTQTAETNQKFIEDLGKRFHAANSLFESHRLYLSRGLADQVYQTMTNLFVAISGVSLAEGQGEAEILERRLAQLQEWDNREGPAFRKAMTALEDEFRGLLGSEALPSEATGQ